MDRAAAERFAEDWIDSWNNHDLERILAHYTDDFEMHSPKIKMIMGREDGRLQGKLAIREYWGRALAANPSLHFELVDVLSGVDSITIYYRNTATRMAAETFLFNSQGLVYRAHANYA